MAAVLFARPSASRRSWPTGSAVRPRCSPRCCWPRGCCAGCFRTSSCFGARSCSCSRSSCSTLPGQDFGEREHLLLALVVPYLLLAAARASGREIPAAAAVLIGLLAGAAFALKPHFVLLWLAIEVLPSADPAGGAMGQRRSRDRRDRGVPRALRDRDHPAGRRSTSGWSGSWPARTPGSSTSPSGSCW